MNAWRHTEEPKDLSVLDSHQMIIIQGDSVARGPKLLSIKNDVIEIMTWKFICTYRERCKIGPAHNRCWNWSPFTSKHIWMRFSKFWNTFPKGSTLTTWISERIKFGASSDRITLYLIKLDHAFYFAQLWICYRTSLMLLGTVSILSSSCYL